MFGIVLIFVHIPGGDLVYSVLGLVIFAGFACSTSSGCGRSADMRSAPMLAASIFLDILNVFLFFLQIFSGGERLTGHEQHRRDPGWLRRSAGRARRPSTRICTPHPELSHAEHRTAGRVAERLQEYGFTVQTGIGGTGVVGVLSNGSGTGPAPAPGRTGRTARQGRHRRGLREHGDGQRCRRPRGAGRPCLRPLGICPAWSAWPASWPITGVSGTATLLALFQPAEETGDGAQDMVDDGLLKRIPAPDVALSQHLLPGIAGTVATCSGPFMSDR